MDTTLSLYGSALISIIASYLLGSISFGIIISRLFKLPDPRTIGSKNPGATNVLRSKKKLPALLTLLGDGFKGWLPVWLALEPDSLMSVTALIGFAVFIGHLYPIFYRFQGGKGVATFIGISLALSPNLAIAIVITWLIVFAISRYSSLAGLSIAFLSPIYAHFILSPYLYFQMIIALICVFLVWRHRKNIQRLLKGTEDKFKINQQNK